MARRALDPGSPRSDSAEMRCGRYAVPASSEVNVGNRRAQRGVYMSVIARKTPGSTNSSNAILWGFSDRLVSRVGLLTPRLRMVNWCLSDYAVKRSNVRDDELLRVSDVQEPGLP